MEPGMGCAKCFCYRWCVYGFKCMSESFINLHGINGKSSQLCGGRVEERKYLTRYDLKNIRYYTSILITTSILKVHIMDRREALSRVALIFGGTIIGAEAFLSGCKTTPAKEGLFAAGDVSLLDEIGETILPATASSPGAKEAQ